MATPQLTYRSAFADYKPYQDAPLADWREVNDTVAGTPGGASGHAGHGLGGMNGMTGMKGMAGMAGMDMPPAAAAAASAPMKMPMKPMAMPKPKPMHDGHSKTGGTP